MAVATSAAMASTSAIGSNQLAASKNGVFSSTKALAAPSMAAPLNKKRAAVVAMSGAPAYVPDMAKRNTVNLLLLGAIGLPTASLAGGYAYFFYPPGGGGGGGGITAKDALGNDIIASAWLATHPVGDRTLAQGLKGDPTYLVVEGETGNSSLATYGVNAVCTHLGCVVPWNAAENKFMCPCHGSQYNNQGRVVRGPAPLSLALAHADIVDDKVIFSTWTETDFRTGEAPWWS